MSVQSRSTTAPDLAEDAAPEPVLFGVFQTGQRSNGGVESVTQLLEHLGREAVVLTQGRTPINARWIAAGHAVEVVEAPFAMPGHARLAAGGKLRRMADMMRVNLRTAGLLRRRGIKAVHCNDPAAFWHMRFGAALAGAKVIYNARDTLDLATFSFMRRLKWRAIFALSSKVVMLSGEMKAFYVERLRLPPRAAAKIEVIPSIVDHAPLAPPSPAEQARLRKRLGIAPDVFTVGYIATFNPKKGQAEFLAKAGPLLKASGRTRCVFIGDFNPDRSPYARQCAGLIEDLGLGDVVRCVGASDAVHDWYRALDAVVLASRHEGLARCMIEGMSAGLPVVSFDVCSARETLEETASGLVAPQGDYAMLVDHLTRLAGDPALRARMGEAARAHARGSYQGETVAGAYLDVYRAARR